MPLFLEDGVNALLAEPENPEAFAEKLCWVVEHPEEAAAIGKKGAKVAMEKFNSRIESEKLGKMILDK